jgi:hypothetical protein
MSGAIHLLPQYTFMVWCLVKAQGQLYLYFFTLQVNQSRVLGVEFDQASGCETFYDRERQPLLTVTFNTAGLPQSWYPANGGQPVNITYDRWGKMYPKLLHYF